MKTVSILAIAAFLPLAVFAQKKEASITFDSLPYAFNALEPYIDAKTMEIHYTRHHRGYFDNLLKAINENSLGDKPLSELLAKAGTFPPAIRNNAGGHYNHTLFWKVMAPNAGGVPQGVLGERIVATFGSFDKFKEEFTKAAMSRFGSGWAWLCVADNGTLFITSTPNQDNPLMDVAEKRGTPILGLDVWEHAYYLNYQNKRASYIDAFWNIVNWPEVSSRYLALTETKKQSGKK
ncbi:MAG: superoxide dismutase [Fibrobacter sp.]|nr:superoxide dismutase [Fibrobacter sp.]